MKNKKSIMLGLAILLVGLVYFAVQAQQKKGTARAGFAGEWESKESISMGGNIVCCFDAGDRMLAKKMKVAKQANFLTIQASSSFADEAAVTTLEKLTLDGKTTDIDNGQGRGKKFSVKMSADGKTMTINSVVRLMIDKKQTLVHLTEVWKLSNDGETITVQSNATSDLYSKGRSWKTVFNKVG
jgi:hypothetical protein